MILRSVNNHISNFVSNRIDIYSYQVNNCIYQPILDGAFRTNESIGDNTGDNISHKQPHYSELTVQYWAWKNQNCDYYGLCHYRRYLSFSDKVYPVDRMNFVIEPILNKASAKKYGLLDSTKIEGIVTQYDAVVNESAAVELLPVPSQYSHATSVLDLWQKHDDVFINASDIDTLINIIKEHFPIYYESALDYLHGTKHRGYNCYVLKKDLFFELNEFQFGVMEYFEKQIDINNYPEHLQREFGYMCEIMYGIFIHHLELQGKYKINERQLVLFMETKYEKNPIKRVWYTVFSYIVKFSRHRFDWLIPEGSRRRNTIIRIVNILRGRKK